MLWIVGAYILLTIGEVLVYGTMLDLSYAYAPARMKGFITACFLVTNALGNLINRNTASTTTPRSPRRRSSPLTPSSAWRRPFCSSSSPGSSTGADAAAQ